MIRDEAGLMDFVESEVKGFLEREKDDLTGTGIVGSCVASSKYELVEGSELSTVLDKMVELGRLSR